MTINYTEFNPIQYFSKITQVEGYSQGKDSPDLQIELVDQKAKEVLGILQDRGIEAKLAQGAEGRSQVRIPREAIDKLIACQKALGVLAPLDVSPLVKAIKTPSLSISDKKQVEAVLREIRDNKNMSVPELMKRSDLNELQSMINEVYNKCSNASGVRRLINRAFFRSNSFEGICAHVLEAIATAKTEQEDNSRRIFEELDNERPDASTITELLRAGADLKLVNTMGNTALAVAVNNGYDRIVQAFIERGADINQVMNKGGRTALDIAVEKGYDRMVKVLIEKGADIHRVDAHGWTALHVAAFYSRHEVVRALLEKGADVNKADKNGWTALHIAAEKGDHQVVRALIEKGADVSKADKNGWTALHVAAEEGDHQLVRALLDKGADVNWLGKDGVTPLHIAMSKGYPETIEMLLTAGADVKQADSKGQTPLHIAMVKNYQMYPDRLMTFLTERGYGRDLLLLAMQESKGTNLQALLHALTETKKIDTLIPDLLPLDNFATILTMTTIFNLIVIAKTDSIVAQFLEKLVIAKMSNHWMTEDLESGELQRLLGVQHFLFRQGSDPFEFFVKTAEAERRITKIDFYELWALEMGDPENIKEIVLNPRRQPEEGSYALRLEKSEVQEHPEQILKTLSEQFQDSIHLRLSVEFEGEPGVDEGGLGRQFLGQLFSAIGGAMQFEKRENGLFRPRLRENSEGEFLPLTENERATYWQLGQLIMFCLNADVSYPIGMVFDQGVFTAIARMNPKDLRKEFEELNFNDPEIFSRMLLIYKEINRYSESDVKMIERLESYLAPKSSEELVEAYALVIQDPSIQKLKINEDLEKIKLHQTEIQEAVRKYIINNNLRRTFAPLHTIAKGMLESSFNTWVNFRDVQRAGPVKLSETLQGTVSKADILDKLQFQEGIPDNIKSWFKLWIEQADDKKLGYFIFALSGSSALGRDVQIKINKGGNIAFHTCFNTLDVNWYKNKETKEPYSEQELTKNLEWAIQYVQEHSGFDMA